MENEATTTTETTTTLKPTPIPLANLLNRIFGDDRWKTLLRVTRSTPIVPKTTTPRPVQHGQGFQNFQISADRLLESTNKQEQQKETGSEVNKPELPSRVGNKSFANDMNSESSGNIPTDWSHHGEFYINGGGHSNQNAGSANQQFHANPLFLNTVTQTPILGALEQLKPNFEGYMNIPKSNGWFSSVGSSFDPDKVNSQAKLYDPNSAFNSFVTQTGSRKENSGLHTSYDANAVNQRYMQSGTFHYPTGVAHTSQSAKGNQHPYSVYGGSRIFDADALNTALMNAALGLVKGNYQPGSQYNSGFTPFQNFQPAHTSEPQSQLENQHLSEHTENGQQPKHRQNILHKENQGQPTLAVTTPQPQIFRANNQFGFIPGGLSSGGRAGTEKFAHGQQYARPSFLSSEDESQAVSLFDPNSLNAAQPQFNPNAISWLTPRGEPRIPFEMETEDEPMFQNVSLAANETLANPINETTALHETKENKDVSSIPNTNGNLGFSGFDPNIINAHQGQSSFVPGQISPHFFDGSGFNPNQENSQRPLTGYESSYNSQSNMPPGMNFDIQNLLGIGAIDTNSSGKSIGSGYSAGGFGQNIGGFNPDSNMFGNNPNFGSTSSWDGFTPGGGAGLGSFSSNSGNNASGMPSGLGMYFSGSGFDANAVNMPGFGTFQPLSNGRNGSGSSFVGFGGYPSMNGGGYAGTYDPNLVNQHLIQSPFGSQTSNSTGNSMDYFLGVSNTGQNMGGGSSYQSAFISAFDPSSVNQAFYDPDKYNTAHMNFDPLEMLSKNPGMDKATLQSATYDPDKTNAEYTQINFSPVGMIASSLGHNSSVLNTATFDPSSVGQASFIPSKMGAPYSQLSSNLSSQTQPVFDPVEIMRQLMQDSSIFIPGTSGSQHMNFDPSSMFQQGTPTGTALQETTQQPNSSSQPPVSNQPVTGAVSSTNDAAATTNSMQPSTLTPLMTILTTVPTQNTTMSHSSP